MCGICGFPRHGRDAPAGQPAAPRSRRWPSTLGAPRAGRRRPLGRRRRRRGARPPPAVDHRSVAGRPPADGSRLRALRHHLQRRDLQLPRAARRARAARRTRFRGHSDTEVLLAAIARVGRRARRCRGCNGMFAFALWDRQTRRLTLARDRLGKKPLYYGWCGDDARCSRSELKALRAHPGVRPRDRPRCARPLFLRFGCVPGAALDLRGVRKLPPGTLLERRCRRRAALPEPRAVLVGARGRARGRRRARSAARSTRPRRALEALLRDAVARAHGRRRAARRVPVGRRRFHAVVALMQARAAGRCGRSRSAFASRSTTRRRTPRRSPRISAPSTPSSTSRREDALAVDPAPARASTTSRSPTPSQIPTVLVCRARPPARHGRALGRRRRRAVRRLQALPPGRCDRWAPAAALAGACAQGRSRGLARALAIVWPTEPAAQARAARRTASSAA